MLTDYAAANDVELWNTTRLQTYLTNVGSPFDTGPSICTCPSLTATILGHDPYTTPDDPANPAPWFDENVPQSAGFLGFLPLSIDGIDDNPRVRSVSAAVGGGGVFGPTRERPRTMTVSGVLIGTTCCGAEYGLNYMSEVLSGCVGPNCDGDCLQMYNCCPDEGLTPEQFNAAHRRTFRRTSLVEGPTVTRRRVSGTCAESNCAAGAELIDVEFIIVAANPWAWSDPAPFLNVFLPVAGEGDCVDWCVSDGDTLGFCEGEPCLFFDCNATEDCAADPLLPVVTPPQPTLPSSAFCIALVPETACYELDLTDRPRWSEDVPIITVFSSNQELRNVRIAIYEKPDELTTCDASQDDFACQPVNEFNITYMPPLSTVTIDGQTGRALIDCGDGCQPATNVYGDSDGGPVIITGMNCALYCICVSVDSALPVSSGATLELHLSGRGL
jgi:hypothetical protein